MTKDLAADSIVMQFLTALEQQDHQTIEALLAPNLRYTNVSLPTLKGGTLVAKVFKQLLRQGTGFEVAVHHLAVNNNIVMTERTDILKVGPLHIRFWVCGTFCVENGQITVWRDYFDWVDFGKGTMRGMLGVAIPRLRATLS